MSGMVSIWRYLLRIAVSSAWVLTANCAFSQITPDRTLPNNSSVTINGNTFNITGGTQAGRNLFHSFQQFSVPTGGTASFNNGLDIQNIFSRITGGSVSNIDGVIKALGNANVFFLNPNGIVFGKNASLNIGGSFVATTANAIQFGNIGTFSASVPNNPALLTVNPSAFFYNQIAAASIQNNSIAPVGKDPAGFNALGLRVPNGKTLVLVGGNTIMDGGQLNTYGGRVELGGLASSGIVGIQVNGNDLSLSFPHNIIRANVSLANGASVNVNAAGGGSITINANNLNITDGSSLNAGIGEGLGFVEAKAGDITLNAMGKIRIVNGSVANQIRAQAKGNAGNINITATTLSISNGSDLSASTFGSGKAGNITIRATDFVELNNGSLFSQSDKGSTGSAGDVNIETGSLFVLNNAQISTGTIRTSSGAGGSLTINVLNSLDLDNSGIFTDTEGMGVAGNLKITTRQLSIKNGGVIFGGTSSTGRGGNMTINASSVDIVGSSGIFSESTGAGDAGTIIINTNRLSIQQGGVLAARTSGAGKGGTLTINATDSVELSGQQANAPTSLSSQTKGTGAGGTVTINTRRLKVEDGAQISVSTFGQGKGGNLELAASDSIDLSGRSQSGFSSGLFAQVNVGGIGDAGNLKVTTRHLTLNNGAKISVATLGVGQGGNLSIMAPRGVIKLIGTAADGTTSSITGGTDGTGNAGNVNITTGKLIVQAGAIVEASTLGFGEGGSLTINASDSINLEGLSANARFFSGLTTQTLGAKTAGNLTLNTARLNIQNGARVSVGSLGTGKAGDLEINARSVQLDNRGSIFSGTNSANGGNISLRLQELLVLRRNSQISSTAGITQQNGNGGNITINAPNGFIVALPDENSDITANAFQGSAGKVTINATGIFGLKPRSRQELEHLLQTTDPTKLNPRQLPTSDITAISQTNPSLNGQVSINTPDIDPSKGLQELPIDIFDVSRLINHNLCVASQKSEFIVTGRGGLPPSPYDILSPDTTWEDWWISPQPQTKLTPTTHNSSHKQHTPSPAMIAAQGWVKDANGNVILTAKPVTATPQGSWLHPQNCQMLRG